MTKYAIATVLFKGFSLNEALDKIGSAGFCEIELSGSEGHLDDWSSTPARTRRIVESRGMVVRSMHSPKVGWDNGNPDADRRRASVEAAAASFWPAAEVGAEIVICHANTPTHVYTQDEFETNWALSRDSLAILAERAREAGLKMAVENLPRKGMPRPCSSVSEVLRMIDGLGEHVGVCIDAGHSNANSIPAADEVLIAGQSLFSLHIQDNDGLGTDQHLVPGRGTADWGAFLEALTSINFSGPRAFEVVADGDAEEKLSALAELRTNWESR